MGVMVLDGGMGQELIARAETAPTPLWATQVMLERPELIRAVHDDFFAAGAAVATANTYGLHHDRLLPHGLDDRFEDLHRIACDMAIAARDAAGDGLVAGALGPLGWSYTTEDGPEDAVARFDEIAALLAPRVDLLLIETASSLAQARAALLGARSHERPVWLAVSVDDADGTQLRSGEPLRDVIRLAETDGAEALLINCSTPEAVSDGLAVLGRAGLPLGAYANGFTGIARDFVQPGATVAKLSARTDLTPAAYADFAERWVEMGATIVGGCCEVGPAHIAELARRFA